MPLPTQTRAGSSRSPASRLNAAGRDRNVFRSLAIGQREGPSQAGEPFAAAEDVGGDVDPDLAGVDQGDVDAALGQGAEHPGGDAGVGAHAHAQDRELGELRLDRDLARPDAPRGLGGSPGGTRGAR